MPEATRTPPKGVPAALLFEDNSVFIEEVSHTKKEEVDRDIKMKFEEIDSVMKDEFLLLPDTLLDEKGSPSPSSDDGGHTSTTPPAGSKSKNKPTKKEPQLIGDLPRAEEDAMKTFSEIPENHYQYGTLGRSREVMESMTCDCQYEHGQSNRRCPPY
jgi:[histone H3]-lysine36 N-trimethyltransferase